MSVSSPSTPASARRLNLPILTVVMWVAIAITVLAIGAPLVVLFHETFMPNQSVRAFTWANYVGVINDRNTYALLRNTIGFSLGLTVVAGSFGFFFAWLASRTNAPLRRFMAVAILLPYIVPPMLGSIAWILLLNPSNGLLNAVLRDVAGLSFNIYSFSGMVFVESVYAFPLAFTFFYASLVSLDPSLEEASAAAGASVWRTVTRVTLPSVWPTILSVATLLFVIGLESFDVAWFIGYPAKIFTLSTEMFLLTFNEYPPKYGMAAVYGILTLTMSIALIVAYRRVVRNQERFTAITGKAYRSSVIDIGHVGTVASVVFYFLIALIGVLPVLMLTAIALDAVAWPFHWSGRVSLENFIWIFTDGDSLRALKNTIFLTVFGAIVVVVLSFIITYLTTRTRERGRGLLDYLAFLPFGIPTTVLAIGIILAMISTPVYNTVWILIFAFVLKFLPYGLRNISGSLMQIHPELEEASAASGASFATTLRRILVPLVMPGVIAAWSLLFIVFSRQFSLPIMLSSVDTSVLTIILYQEWEGGNIGHVAAYGVLLVFCAIPLVILARMMLGSMRSI